MVGPIERSKNLLPQLSSEIHFNALNLIEGGKRIIWGVFKKLVVADRISIFQTAVFGNIHHHSGTTIFIASLLYTFQVYADFSGYTDIAIGSARLFGYNLIENFNHPFFSKSLSEFWRRWHISLSSWVNEYIFNPISFKRRLWGKWGVFYALFISFIIIGIWHGATWNFVLFGFLHALILSYEFYTKKMRKKVSLFFSSKFYNLFSVFLTYFFVTFSLIIFRTSTISESWDILSALFLNKGVLYYDKIATVLFILIGILIIILKDFKEEYNSFKIPVLKTNSWFIHNLSYSLLLVYILIASVFDGGEFIYFSF